MLLLGWQTQVQEAVVLCGMVQVLQVGTCRHGQPAVARCQRVCVSGQAEWAVARAWGELGMLKVVGEGTRGQPTVRGEVCGRGRGQHGALGTVKRAGKMRRETGSRGHMAHG